MSEMTLEQALAELARCRIRIAELDAIIAVYKAIEALAGDMLKRRPLEDVAAVGQRCDD